MDEPLDSVFHSAFKGNFAYECYMDVSTLAFYNGKFSFFNPSDYRDPRGRGRGVIRKPQFALLKRVRSS